MADLEQTLLAARYNRIRPGSEYLALQPEVNVNARANARIVLGSILAFVVRLH